MGASCYNNKIFPSGIIYQPNVNNKDYSYAHSVLQSLLLNPIMNESGGFLNIILLNNNNNNYKDKYPLTNEIMNIYQTINSRRTAYSNNLIAIFSNILEQKKNVLMANNGNLVIDDPYNFLYYLLHFLHLELNFSDNNFDKNSLNNIPLYIKRQRDKMQDSISNFLLANHSKSVIFKYFFNTVENTYLCQRCGQYYDHSLNSIITMDVAQIYQKRNLCYPFKAHSNINLNDCFDCYCEVNDYCQFCGEIVTVKKIIYNSNCLIIRFKRNNLGNKCDIDFPYEFDISKYRNNDGNNQNNIFVLKSCISYSNIPNFGRKYLADINIGVNINLGRWVRYLDSTNQELKDFKELFNNEPQLLIYQIKGLEQNNDININQGNYNIFNNQTKNLINTNFGLFNNNNNNFNNNNISNNNNNNYNNNYNNNNYNNINNNYNNNNVNNNF